MKKTLYFIWTIIIIISFFITIKYVKTYIDFDYMNILSKSNLSFFKYVKNEDEKEISLLNSTFGKYNLYSYAKIYDKDIKEDYFNRDLFLQENNEYEYNIKKSNIENDDELEINYLHGGEFVKEEKKEKEKPKKDDEAVAVLKSFDGINFTLNQLNDFNFLIRNFYIVDESTVATKELFDAKKLLNKDMKLKQNNKKPQILIYHTHSSETYINSRANKEDDTVVGVGKVLKKILEDEYGYNVIHDTTKYDVKNGYLDRNKAYNYAKDGVSKILDDNPSIEVLIDLHRDAKKKRSTTINGKECAQIMLFNGLSRDKKGPITYLDNPNLSGNLAFSLQLQLKSLEKYPGLFYKNYLKYLRFNLHLREKAILVELGTENNTIESAKNSMDPLAEILDDVLKGR